MIHGNEQIDLNFIQNMELKDFVESSRLNIDCMDLYNQNNENEDE